MTNFDREMQRAMALDAQKLRDEGYDVADVLFDPSPADLAAYLGATQLDDIPLVCTHCGAVLDTSTVGPSGDITLERTRWLGVPCGSCGTSFTVEITRRKE